MDYRLSKDIPKIKLTKDMIVDFYNESKKYLGKEKKNNHTRCLFEVKISQSDISSTYDSFEEFNNHVMKSDEISVLNFYIFRFSKKDETYSISLYYNKDYLRPNSIFSNGIVCISNNKLWVDETTNYFAYTYFGKLIEKNDSESSSALNTFEEIQIVTKPTVTVNTNKIPLYKETWFIGLLTFIVTAVGIIASIIFG